MHHISRSELKRDCAAFQIPAGHQVVLPAGTAVDITQTLGGSYTVKTDAGLFRIGGEDADALGLEVASLGGPAAGTNSASKGPPNGQILWDILKTCYDPEIPVNIVDLGLVYDLHLESLRSGGSRVCVKMTLTAPGCGMGTVIAADAQQKLLEVDGVEEAQVEVVWDPPWHHSMISPAGRTILGLD